MRKVGILLSAASLCLISCQTPFYEKEDPEVARRCSPIRSVLAKNYDSRASASVLGYGGGYSLTTSGPQVSAEAALRLIEEDRVCRGWVAGVVKPEDFGDFLMKSAAASVVHLTGGADEPEAAQNRAALKKALDDLRAAYEKANVPVASRPDGEKVRLQALEYAMKEPHEISADLTIAYSSLGAEFDRTYSTLGTMIRDGNSISEGHYLVLASKLDSTVVLLDGLGKKVDDIEARLLAERKRGGESGPDSKKDGDKVGGTEDGTTSPKPVTKPGSEQAAVPVFKRAVTIHFLRNDATISESERARLWTTLKQFKGKRVRFDVLGYADLSGSRDFNEYLSLRRAMAVKDWLVDELGAVPSYVSASGRLGGTGVLSGVAADNRAAIVWYAVLE